MEVPFHTREFCCRPSGFRLLQKFGFSLAEFRFEAKVPLYIKRPKKRSYLEPKAEVLQECLLGRKNQPGMRESRLLIAYPADPAIEPTA